LLGLHCQELDYLDVSFNKAVTGEGVRALVGCQNLAKLLIFDCAVFEKEVAKVGCGRCKAALPHFDLTSVFFFFRYYHFYQS